MGTSSWSSYRFLPVRRFRASTDYMSTCTLLLVITFSYIRPSIFLVYSTICRSTGNQRTQGFLYKCRLFVDRGARQPHRPQGIMGFHKDPGANLLPLAAHMNLHKCSPLKGTIMRQIMKHTWDLHYMHSATIQKRRTRWRFKLKHSQEKKKKYIFQNTIL